MTQELQRDAFAVITHDIDKGIIELKWLEGSANMTDEDFMRSMESYAGFAQRFRAPSLLVDVTEFRHSPGEQVTPWRDQKVIPEYNAAGVTRFAFLLPPGSPDTVENGTTPQKEPPGEFPTGYFDHREHAVDWLSASAASS